MDIGVNPVMERDIVSMSHNAMMSQFATIEKRSLVHYAVTRERDDSIFWSSHFTQWQIDLKPYLRHLDPTRRVDTTSISDKGLIDRCSMLGRLS